MKKINVLIAIVLGSTVSVANAGNLPAKEVWLSQINNEPIYSQTYDGLLFNYNLVTRRPVDLKIHCSLHDVNKAWFDYDYFGVIKKSQIFSGQNIQVIFSDDTNAKNEILVSPKGHVLIKAEAQAGPAPTVTCG